MDTTADTGASNDGGAPAWPPTGWVTNREAARLLGVSLETLTCGGWKWQSSLRGHARCVRIPMTGGRCNIYSLKGIEQIIAAREEASRPKVPEGFVDMDGAARMFGLSRSGWKGWVRIKKIRCGQTIPSPVGARLRIYAITDLERLREELFDEDKLYKRGTDGIYHVPAGLVRREEAWERFGVGRITWERWEREGLITCGIQVPGGPKLYKVEDIERLLEEHGTFCPPYPDPAHPGCFRVPLGGRGITRREALIDAATLLLIKGKSCTWSGVDAAAGFVAVSTPGAGGTGGGGLPLRRVIMGITELGLNVRHVNGDPLDCRRENLIVRTVKQRARNNRKMKTFCGQPCTSRFKGVSWHWRMKRWSACIHMNKKKRQLGKFHDEIAAAQAYDEAAREWFGEHARLNFPDGIDAFLARGTEGHSDVDSTDTDVNPARRAA